MKTTLLEHKLSLLSIKRRQKETPLHGDWDHDEGKNEKGSVVSVTLAKPTVQVIA